MNSTPFRRALAVLLCFSPFFWMSNPALAQTLDQAVQQRGVYSTPPAYGPSTDAPPASAPGFPGYPPDLAGAEASRRESVRGEGTRGEPALTVPGPSGAPAIDEPLDPDRYVCGPGDVLDLNFWGVQNFKQRVTVDLEGRAFVPKVGHLDLRGKTLSGARAVTRESVARYFPGLKFELTLAEPRTFLVQVVDDVVRPGSYAARAIERVATIISRAGGFGRNASKRRVEVRRRDGTVLNADLLLYTLTGDVKHNPYLLDGDVVRVPFEEVAASISGAVNRPGRYELTGKRDLAELVELAGGLAPTATQRLPVSVVRRSSDDRQDQTLIPFMPDGKLPAKAIQHEDIVRVPEFGDLQRSVIVIGAVAGVTTPEEATATRRLPFVEGDSVRTLLERVGGVGPVADLTGSYVLRQGQSLPVDLYSLVMLRDFRADRGIELGDTLVVPFKRRNIVVDGAVFKPGTYPYNPNFGIQQYLSLAGGPNRFAQKLSNVRVVTPNGDMKKYDADLKVEPGSSLIVPERNFSRSEVVQILLSAAGIIVSGTAVVMAARR